MQHNYRRYSITEIAMKKKKKKNNETNTSNKSNDIIWFDVRWFDLFFKRIEKCVNICVAQIFIVLHQKSSWINLKNEKTHIQLLPIHLQLSQQCCVCMNNGKKFCNSAQHSLTQSNNTDFHKL